MTEPLADTYIVELRKVNKFNQIKKGDLFITSNSLNSCFVAKDDGQIQDSPTYGVVEADSFIEVDAKKLIEHVKSSSNEVFQATVKDIIEDKIYCPLPLEAIPNLLGINLVSVGGVEWVRQPDNQLVSITINFNPESLN